MPQSKTEREQQLINARKACAALAPYATGAVNTAILRDDARKLFADLLNQFGRLDATERKQIEAGKKHGKKGGRPKGDKPPLTDAERSRRKRARKAESRPSA